MREWAKVTAKAASQAGLISKGQLLALKVTDGECDVAVRNGTFVSVRRGVYRLAGVPLTSQAALWSAVLCAGQGAVVSHVSAGWLWRLEGLGRRAPDVVDVSVLRPREVEPMEGVRLHRVRVLEERKDTFAVGGIACTGLARTVVDLAGVLSREDLEIAFDCAWRRSLKFPEWVTGVIERLGARGRRGAGVLQEIIEARGIGPTGSPMEVVVRGLLRRAGLPEPLPQFSVVAEDGDQIAVVDFAWPEQNVAVFVQSWQWHSSPTAYDKDMAQVAALKRAGWNVYPVSQATTKRKLERMMRELRAELVGVTVISDGNSDQFRLGLENAGLKQR